MLGTSAVKNGPSMLGTSAMKKMPVSGTVPGLGLDFFLESLPVSRTSSGPASTPCFLDVSCPSQTSRSPSIFWATSDEVPLGCKAGSSTDRAKKDCRFYSRWIFVIFTLGPSDRFCDITDNTILDWMLWINFTTMFSCVGSKANSCLDLQRAAQACVQVGSK